MRIEIVGGGPAGLYAGLLIKKQLADSQVIVHERNRADDTFGFGIVLSAETLGNLRAADESSWSAISNAFAYWDDLYVHFKGTTIRSTGHAFSGLERLTLLRILQSRAEEIGVEIHYGSEIPDLAELSARADLVIGADGANSAVREAIAKNLRPEVDLRSNRFVWLGTDLPLPGFTYYFVRDKTGGIWTVHAYQYKVGASTVVVETTPEVFARSGLDESDEAGSVAFLENLFTEFLGGHRLQANRSIWRRFPTIRCGAWSCGNVVLIGDAAHTAHFSIGSGTKLALEDAIDLSRAVANNPHDLHRGLAAYEKARREEVEKTQHAADVSLRWFESVDRVSKLDPIQFNYSLLSRSKQITHENLRLRDPELVEKLEYWYAARNDPSLGSNLPVPPPMFVPFQLRGLSLSNRVVVSPMCQYSAKDGTPNDWHLMHLGSRAVGGAGLIVTEMTCVSRNGRITPGCAGMYKGAHIKPWKRIVDFVHGHSTAKTCLQLGHAGRKGSTQLGWEEMDRPLPKNNWPLISASPIPYFPDSQVPREATRSDMDQVRNDFVASAHMALSAGFDMLEIHFAHGYLLASFLSPVTNRRNDEYGGSLENRMRFPLEVFDAVRKVWPEDRPISVRLSATDWIEDEGLTGEDSVEIARMLKQHGCDIIDVSTGQTAPEAKPVYGRMYQTPFAEQIRLEVGMPTMAVGAITTADQVNTILTAGRADLVALARPHLADPHFTLKAAADYDFEGCFWPKQYLSGRQQLFSSARKAKAEVLAKSQVSVDGAT